MTPLEQARFSRAQWRFLLCSIAAYAFFYITRKNLSMAQPAMLEEGVISTYALGLIMTAHGVLYGISRFVNGFWCLPDGASGIYMRKSEAADNMDWVKGLGPGTHVAALGKVMRDKFDFEPFLSLRGLKKIKIQLRTDKSERKRTELHLHTNMSQMDAIITPKELVSTAIRW